MRLPAALEARDFRLLFFGQLVSLAGMHMQRVAIAWHLYLLTHSPFALGTLGLCRVVPVIVFALGGGVVADALDRRRLLMVTQTVLASTSLALALVTHAHHASAVLLYGLSAVAGVAFAFDNPARQALVPLLVPRADLPGALSLSAMAWQIAEVVGPAVGGLLLAWRGVVPLYLIDAISYGAVIAALVALRHRAPPRTSQVRLTGLVAGLRFLRRERVLLGTMVLDFVATFLAGAMLLMPVYANEVLHVGPRGLGLFYAAQPVGAALASAWMALRPLGSLDGRALLASIVVYGLGIAGFGASRWLALSFVMLALSGAGDTVSMVIRQTLRQLLTPDELRGRMTAVNMIFFLGGPQLGEFEAGVVAGLWGPVLAVTTGGLGCVLATLLLAVCVPGVRRLRYRVDASG